MSGGKFSDGPHHQTVSVISELQERPFLPSEAEPLRDPRRHPEHDPVHGALYRVALSWRDDPEVLAHGRARARHPLQDDAAILVDHELLRDWLLVHRVVSGDGE